jgi:hypothetical protein
VAVCVYAGPESVAPSSVQDVKKGNLAPSPTVSATRQGGGRECVSICFVNMALPIRGNHAFRNSASSVASVLEAQKQGLLSFGVKEEEIAVGPSTVRTLNGLETISPDVGPNIPKARLVAYRVRTNAHRWKRLSLSTGMGMSRASRRIRRYSGRVDSCNRVGNYRVHYCSPVRTSMG